MPRKRGAAPKKSKSPRGPAITPNPRSAMLDSLPMANAIDLFLDEEIKAVKAVRSQGKRLAELGKVLVERLEQNARVVYVGDGTAGRIAAFEAAECGPLFGLPPSLFSSVIAGGPLALTRPIVDGPEARREAEQRMRKVAIGPGDLVVMVADEPLSPFLRASLDYARHRKTRIILLTTAPPVEDGRHLANDLLEIDVGIELIAEATRHKAATALKIALATLSSASFVHLGKTYGGFMVDVRPTTPGMWRQAVRVVSQLCGLDDESALRLIREAGGRAKIAIAMHHARIGAVQARQRLVQCRGMLRAVVGDLDSAG